MIRERSTDRTEMAGDDERPVIEVACLGDSITRGRLSVDYLPLLGGGLPARMRTQRHADDGDFAYNLLQRLDDVLARPADVITVLIGTNDARASLPGYPVEQAMGRKRLPVRPSHGWFEECLTAIVERLAAETDATIGLVSLPVLGQDLDGAAAGASRAYSQTIADVARDHGLSYVSVHERQLQHLRRVGAPPRPYRELTPGSYLGTVLQRSVLRRSLDAISRRRGLVLTTDHIHQNSTGAALIASEIEQSDLFATSGQA